MCSPTYASRYDCRNENAACSRKMPPSKKARLLSGVTLLDSVTELSRRTITSGKASPNPLEINNATIASPILPRYGFR